MSCFEIARSVECRDLFAVLERHGNRYFRMKPTHPIAIYLLDLYKAELPRRSNCVGTQASTDEPLKTPSRSFTKDVKPRARKKAHK